MLWPCAAVTQAVINDRVLTQTQNLSTTVSKQNYLDPMKVDIFSCDQVLHSLKMEEKSKLDL